MFQRLYYFAYGSNLNIERLEYRIGKVIVHGTHVLKDYALKFNIHGYANIVPQKGSQVEGVLFRVSESDLKQLDRYEGFYNRSYFRVGVGGLAVTYIGMKSKVTTDILPTEDYLEHIKIGCRNFGLERTLNMLESVKCEKPFKASGVFRSRGKVFGKRVSRNITRFSVSEWL